MAEIVRSEPADTKPSADAVKQSQWTRVYPLNSLGVRCCKRAGPVAQRSEQRTHNPLVLGSNPSGPTNVFKKFRHYDIPVVFFRLRIGCSRLRIRWSIQLIDPCNIGTRDQMSVGVDGDLYRAVPHLLLYVRKAGARLNQMRRITMAQRMKCDPAQPAASTHGRKCR